MKSYAHVMPESLHGDKQDRPASRGRAQRHGLMTSVQRRPAVAFADCDRHNGCVDRDFRDWLRSLAVHRADGEPPRPQHAFSDEDAAYLVRIARDGTLAAAFAEIAATEPELAG